MKVDFSYDNEEDIVYFYTSEKEVDFSIDYDDIILDVSGNKIEGIEILNASEKFSKDEEDVKRMKLALSSINEAHMKVDYGINSINVKVGFVSSMPELLKEGMLIQVPIKRELMLEA